MRFRYSMPGGQALEITFSNIRHAFVQEAEKELITLVHFSLKNPIMAGKKKTVNVQFYTEVMGDTAAVRLSPFPAASAADLHLCAPLAGHVVHRPVVASRSGANRPQLVRAQWVARRALHFVCYGLVWPCVRGRTLAEAVSHPSLNNSSSAVPRP